MADSKTYYAWSNFEVLDEDDPGNPRKVKHIKPGDEVSQSILGVDDDEWKAVVEAGSARTQEHPEMGNFQGSPVELRKAQLAAAAEGGFFDTQYGTIGTDEAPEVDPETAKPIPPGTNAPGAK